MTFLQKARSPSWNRECGNHQLRTSQCKAQIRASFTLVTNSEEYDEKQNKKAKINSQQIQLIYPFATQRESLVLLPPFSVYQNTRLLPFCGPSDQIKHPCLQLSVAFHCHSGRNQNLMLLQLVSLFRTYPHLTSFGFSLVVFSLWHQSTELCTCYYSLSQLPSRALYLKNSEFFSF